MLVGNDMLRFAFGFLGMVTFGLSVLVAVGFYQVEVVGSRNVSTTEYGSYKPLNE